MLFEILTLERLHAGATTAERLRSTLSGADARTSIRASQRSVPADLERACVTATALKRTDRYASARDLSRIVDRFLEADRDLPQRLDLARRHAEQAEEATALALTDDADSLEHRRRALRETGRALALDASSSGARRSLISLFENLPAAMPAEAAARFTRQETAQVRDAARFGQFAYLAFAAPIATLTFSGVKSWSGFLALLGSVLGAAVGCAVVARRKKGATFADTCAIIGLSTLAVAMSSGLYGALVLTPSLVVANTLVLDLARLRRYRWIVLCFGASCVLVPFALERLGILPQSYLFGDGYITILPVIRELPERQVRIGLFVASLMIIIVPTLFVWRTSDALSALRKRLYMQNWRLSRLVPDDAAHAQGLALDGAQEGTAR